MSQLASTQGARPRVPPLAALMLSALCQCAGFVTGFAAGHLAQSHWVFLLFYPTIAYGCARLFRLSWPWQLFNLILPAAVCLSFLFPYDDRLPLWIPTLLVLAVLLIYLPTFWTRVPFYPTSNAMYEVIAAELPADKPFTFVDLGSGFGSLVSYLSRIRPLGTYRCIEISPLPYLLSRLRFLFRRNSRIEFTLGSFWSLSLSDYDYVYAFLSPEPMPRLWQKAQSEMRPESYFLSNTFAVDAAPLRVLSAKDLRKSVLYVHKIGG